MYILDLELMKRQVTSYDLSVTDLTKLLDKLS